MSKNHKTKPQQASEIPKSLPSPMGLRLNIPRLIALERLSQNLERRRELYQELRPFVRLYPKRIQQERLPLLGLRSQRERQLLEQRPPEQFYYPKLLSSIPGPKSMCERRHIRKGVLFSLRIAGKGLRRSPGKGGSYRRTVESSLSCRRR